jgi:DNA-directed RNA polymerase subunit F
MAIELSIVRHQTAINNATELLLLLTPAELVEFARQFVKTDPTQANRLVDALIDVLDFEK